MSARRRGLLPGIACAAIALVVLLIAALQHMAVRTASVGAPNNATVAVLHPATRVCEGPVTSQGSARSVGIWGASAGPTTRLTVDVQDAATSRLLAAGALQAAPVESEWTGRLAHDLPGGRPLRVCLTDDSGTFSLEGSGGSVPTVISTGIPTGQRFSLVLLSDGNRSLLRSLSTAFSRASLWRPSWVGSWTFWVLTFALLGTFAMGVVAVTAAADDDEDRPPRRESRNDDLPPLPDGSPDGRSEAGQDRPQTVP
jgi:hypothetical protein